MTGGTNKVIEDQNVLQNSSANVSNILINLKSDFSIMAKDKYKKTIAIYVKWKCKNIEKPIEREDFSL